jgi:FKBP-type peptidyl-prolyl cis-trans isomerase
MLSHRRALSALFTALIAGLIAGCGTSDVVTVTAGAGGTPTAASSGAAAATATAPGAPANCHSTVQQGPDNFHDQVTLTTLSNGLQEGDFHVGCGQVAASGDTVTVQYTGWLEDGTKFDSSRDRGSPFSFPLGQGQVIQGWDLGVSGMRVGGKRRLVIPASLAYGANGQPPVIPANATLTFDVELLAVQAP